MTTCLFLQNNSLTFFIAWMYGTKHQKVSRGNAYRYILCMYVYMCVDLVYC